MASAISGCGSYLPSNCVSNQQLKALVPDAEDLWIQERTGIKQRYFAAEAELTSDMAFVAAERAIRNSKLKVTDIDLIIVATTTPDRTFPSTATRLQALLGVKNAVAFDLQAVCAGFVYATHVADSMLKSGNYRHAIVVGVDKMSSLLNWQDRSTSVLFGDGAGAIILSNSSKPGIIASEICSDGSLGSILQTDGGVALNQRSGVVTMNGREVFKHAVTKMSSSVVSLLDKCDLSIADIDYFIPHQANIRIINSVAKNLGIEDSKVIKTVSEHANCSAASVPLALDWLVSNHGIDRGSKVIFSAIGAGLVWGSMLIEW